MASTTPGWRGRLEAWSYPLLSRLSEAPRWVTGLGAALLLLGGLFAPSPYGPVLLLIAVAFFTWLVTLSWPQLTAGARVSRAAVVAVLVGVVVLKFLDLP